MKETKITQAEAILLYLKEEGSITHREADRELGVMRLAARIKDLEKSGHKFTKTTEKVPTRYGHTHVTRYALAEQEGGRT